MRGYSYPFRLSVWLLISFSLLSSAEILRLWDPIIRIEDFATGRLFDANNTIPLPNGNGGVKQYIAMQFPSINLPRGTFLDSAALQFTSGVDTLAASEARMVLTVEDEGQSKPLSLNHFDISSRVQHEMAVVWNPTTWNPGEREPSQRTPTFHTLLGSVLSASLWREGNSITIIIEDLDGSHASNFRTIESGRNNAGQGPELIIEYQPVTVVPAGGGGDLGTEEQVGDFIDNNAVVFLSIGCVIIVLATLMLLSVRCRKRSGGADMSDWPVPEKAPTLVAGWELSSEAIAIQDFIHKNGNTMVMRGLYTDPATGAKEHVAVKYSELPVMDVFQKVDFFKEAEALKRIAKRAHENIIQLLGVVSQKMPIMIVTPYMANKDLVTYLKQQRIVFDDFLLKDFASGIASAIQFLHGKKFIHGDIRCSNVLINVNNVPKLTGFHHCCIKSPDTMMPIMSYRHAAPEVFLDMSFSSASDVFAFGITLWEIFSRGVTPYGSETDTSVQTKVTGMYRMPPPVGCPSDIASIMQAAWHQSPGSRPSMVTIQRQLRESSMGKASTITSSQGGIALSQATRVTSTARKVTDPLPKPPTNFPSAADLLSKEGTLEHPIFQKQTSGAPQSSGTAQPRQSVTLRTANEDTTRNFYNVLDREGTMKHNYWDHDAESDIYESAGEDDDDDEYCTIEGAAAISPSQLNHQRKPTARRAEELPPTTRVAPVLAKKPSLWSIRSANSEIILGKALNNIGESDDFTDTPQGGEEQNYSEMTLKPGTTMKDVKTDSLVKARQADTAGYERPKANKPKAKSYSPQTDFPTNQPQNAAVVNTPNVNALKARLLQSKSFVDGLQPDKAAARKGLLVSKRSYAV